MLIIIVLQIILIPLLSPLGIGVIKKIKARLQNRRGPSIFQVYQDLWKLFHKDEVISTDASWIFKIAPFIIFAVTLLIGSGLPLFAYFSWPVPVSDLLFLIYALSGGTFFLALAGLDTGGGFGGFGSSREMTLAALAEGGFIFSLLTLSLIGGTTNLFGIAQSVAGVYSQFLLAILLAFVGFFIVLLAETGRFPFDNPATHLELTMIHEAMILEYSGKRLALLEWAAANKLLIFVALGVNLFFPWGLAVLAGWSGALLGLAAFMAKAFVLYAAIAILESSIAKFRFFRLPDLLITSFILNVIAIGLISYL